MSQRTSKALQTYMQPECPHEGSSQLRSQTCLIGRLYRRVRTLVQDVFTYSGRLYLYVSGVDGCAWHWHTSGRLYRNCPGRFYCKSSQRTLPSQLGVCSNVQGTGRLCEYNRTFIWASVQYLINVSNLLLYVVSYKFERFCIKVLGESMGRKYGKWTFALY